MNTEIEKEIRSAENEARAEELAKLIQPGDRILHTRCTGCVEEHIFTRWEGSGLCGLPTADTYMLNQMEGPLEDCEADDISPLSVTHINRVPVDAVPLLAADAPRSRERCAVSARAMGVPLPGLVVVHASKKSMTAESAQHLMGALQSLASSLPHGAGVLALSNDMAMDSLSEADMAALGWIRAENDHQPKH